MDDDDTASDGADDLDALLAGLGGDDAPAGGGGDDDLDALLAGLGGTIPRQGKAGPMTILMPCWPVFGDTSDSETSSDDEMDPELAALLADL